MYIHNSGAVISFVFAPDKEIFKTVKFDFEWLSQTFKQFAMLNRGMQLLIKDCRLLHLCQNYFSYTDGIYRLFDKAINEKHSSNLFNLFIDTRVKDYAYQLGIGFNPALWKNTTLSYANHIHTYAGGSLEEGVLHGVIKALKNYVSRYPRRTYSFRRSKVKQALTQVLAVRGNNLDWAGCTKAELAVPAIKRQAAALVYKTLLKYLNDNPAHAEEFIAMFDETTYVQTERNLTHCTMQCLVAKRNEVMV